MKYQVHYVRIEHQIYTLEVEADSVDQAEDKADEMFCDGDYDPDSYNVVHAEEYIQNVTLLQEQTA
jgi:hypothetical protein